MTGHSGELLDVNEPVQGDPGSLHPMGDGLLAYRHSALFAQAPSEFGLTGAGEFNCPLQGFNIRTHSSQLTMYIGNFNQLSSIPIELVMSHNKEVRELISLSRLVEDQGFG